MRTTRGECSDTLGPYHHVHLWSDSPLPPMSGRNGGRGSRSQKDKPEDPVISPANSPISAADLLTRSRLRTPRRTTTPSRSLFPDYIDELAPGLTPTSRNSRRRKSSMAPPQTPVHRADTPRRSSPNVAPRPTPSSRILQTEEGVQRVTTSRISRAPVTPSATPGSRSFLRGGYTVSRGKRRSSSSISNESEHSTKRTKTKPFAAWSTGREESPMEMLRRLVNAPGRLYSPTGEDEGGSQSISQQLPNYARQSSSGSAGRRGGSTSTLTPVPESAHPGDTIMDSAVAYGDRSDSSRRSKDRYSMADTSTGPSEAGRARRAARQSQIDNLFSDIGGADGSSMMMKRTDAFPSTSGHMFDLPDDVSALDSSVLGDKDRETELETRLANESTRSGSGADTILLDTSIRRFEDIEESVAREEDASNASDENRLDSKDDGESDDGDSAERVDLDLSVSRPSIEGVHSEGQTLQAGDSYDFEDERSRVDFDFANDEIALSEDEQQGEDSTEEALLPANATLEESDEEEPLDHNKELRAARMSLLRKRRASKKAKRYSPLSGKLVPSLSSTLVKSIFTSFATPSTGLGASQQSKGKVKVEGAASDAVEDLSHHFFSQLSQSLALQADQGGRSTITEKDVVALMKAQGQVSSRNSLACLARRHLPRELSDLITSTTATETTSLRKQRQKGKTGQLRMQEDSIEEEQSRA